ncbi:MAG: hypothetical protein CSB33_04155 [Desulfobacterales bacterium]|nr:MAG: hypothetical protein CSB33_04155 [Desulfobacterales bacterium]
MLTKGTPQAADAAENGRRTAISDPSSCLTAADALLERGETAAAVNALIRMARSAPEESGPLERLARAFCMAGRPEEAARCLEKAISLKAASFVLPVRPADFHVRLGRIRLHLRQWDAARSAFEAALDAVAAGTDKAGSPASFAAVEDAARAGLALACLEQGDPAGGRHHLKSGLKRKPVHPETVLARIVLSRRAGNWKESRRLLRAVLGGRGAEDALPDDPDARIREREIRRRLHLALAETYEALEQPQQALVQAEAAHSHSPFGYDAAAHEMMVDGLISVFSRPDLSLSGLPAQAVNTSRLPVFITGLPGSGARVLGELLALHPDVGMAADHRLVHRMIRKLPGMTPGRKPYPHCISQLNGRLADRLAQSALAHLRRQAPGARRILNVAPLNYRHLGLLSRLFPAAVFLHVVRDPEDLAVTLHLGGGPEAPGFIRSLADLGGYMRRSGRLVSFWRDLLGPSLAAVEMADLFRDPGGVLRTILPQLGLDPAPLADRFPRGRPLEDVNLPGLADMARFDPRWRIGRSRLFGGELEPFRAEYRPPLRSSPSS